MTNILTSPIFYVFLTILFYLFFYTLYTKTKKPYFHPLPLTGVLLIIYILLISNLIKKEPTKLLIDFNDSLKIINIMLGPITVVLALPIYKNWLVLKKYWLPLIISTVVGCFVSLTSIYLLGILFDLDYTLIISLLPKSVTTAIAKEISLNIGAIPEITIAAVIFTGILGSLLGPLLSKIFKFNDPISSGVSFGVSSHAIGTSKAIEISEETGAISSIAIVTTGILTMIVTLFL